MFKGWKQREENARARRDAVPDPEKLAIRAIQRAHFEAEAEKHRLAAEAEREERAAPVRAVVEMLRDAFGPALPEFTVAVKRVGGFGPVAAYLERHANKAIEAERQAERDELAAAQAATIERSRERNLVERAKSAEQRRARQQAAIDARRVEREAEAAQQAEEVA